VVASATLVGGGVGMAVGHGRHGGFLAVNAANAFRAVPTIALISLFAIWPVVSIKWDGFLASYLALFALAIPPILTNTYVGVREIDADVRDAAEAMGLSGPQVLLRVEAPLALPFIMTGIRIAAIEVVATSTLAAYFSYQELGQFVTQGLASQNSVEAFSGSVLVVALAALVAIGFGLLQRLLTPLPLRQRGAGRGLLGAAVGGATR
jgi:osmoprotectant transport system permease protein